MQPRDRTVETFAPVSPGTLVDTASELLEALASGDTESVFECVASGVDWTYVGDDESAFNATGAEALVMRLRRTRLPKRISIACLQAGDGYVVVEERLPRESGYSSRVGTYFFTGDRVSRAWVHDRL